MKLYCIIFTLLILSCLSSFSQEEKKDEPKGKITGEFFGDYFYKISGDTGSLLKGSGQYQQTQKEMHGFEIRRFNLGYDYSFNNTFSAKLLLEGHDGFIVPTKDTRGVYIKYAWLQWSNIFNGSNLIFGSQSTPTFATFTEKEWSYRSVEKNITDIHKHAGSTDVGISLSGRISSSGSVQYYLMVGNGNSSRIENNKYKRVYGSLHGKLFNNHLLFQVYTDFERQNTDADVYIFKGFLGYQNEKLTIAVEPYTRIETVPADNDNITTFGLTLFARSRLIKEKLNGFYRVDLFDEDTNISHTGYRESFMVFGLDYTPLKNINIIPNIWINSYITKDNITTERKGDIVARITFRYKI